MALKLMQRSNGYIDATDGKISFTIVPIKGEKISEIKARITAHRALLKAKTAEGTVALKRTNVTAKYT